MFSWMKNNSEEDRAVIVPHELISRIHRLVLTTHLEDKLACSLGGNTLLSIVGSRHTILHPSSLTLSRLSYGPMVLPTGDNLLSTGYSTDFGTPGGGGRKS